MYVVGQIHESVASEVLWVDLAGPIEKASVIQNKPYTLEVRL